MNYRLIPDVIKTYFATSFREIEPYTHKSFFEEIPDLKDKKLLDVGAGGECIYGLFGYLSQLAETNELAKGEELLNFEENVIALDSSYSKRHCFLPQRSVCGDATCLPFDDESFDIVAMGYLQDILEEKSVLKEAIDESVRVLKPNGYLVGDTPLHPMRPRYEKFRVLKLLSGIDHPKYAEQIRSYQEAMSNGGLEFLKEGIGFNRDNIQMYLTFYFVTQKKESDIF